MYSIVRRNKVDMSTELFPRNNYRLWKKKEPNKYHFHSNETTEYNELNEDLTGNSVEDNKKNSFFCQYQKKKKKTGWK